MLTFSINFVQRVGILLETLEHVGPRVTKPTMCQPSYHVPCLSSGNSPALASQGLLHELHFPLGAHETELQWLSAWPMSQ